MGIFQVLKNNFEHDFSTNVMLDIIIVIILLNCTCSQVNLTDMQSSSHQTQYRWIMVHQCPLTKFRVFCALMSKRAAEAAFMLLDIFLFGLPCILQSDNFSGCAAEMTSELNDIWPLLHIVHGKPCNLQCQRSVERLMQTLKIC